MPNPFAPPSTPFKLPKLEHLPVYLPERELSQSARGRNLINFQRDPDSPRANNVKLTAVERNILSVREHSSFQLRDGCFIPDTQPPPLSPTGRAVTRSQLLELRREQWKADNERSFPASELRTTYPRGVMPGAPGRATMSNGILGRQRFSHLDTSMVCSCPRPAAPVQFADTPRCLHCRVISTGTKLLVGRQAVLACLEAERIAVVRHLKSLIECVTSDERERVGCVCMWWCMCAMRASKGKAGRTR